MLRILLAMEGMPVMNIKPGYCSCGYEVWIEYLWNGQSWACRFLDIEHREIEHCPDCGQALVEDDLESW